METQGAGQTFGIEVQSVEVRGPDDFDPAFETAIRRRPDALITVEDPLTLDYRKNIVQFAEKYRLPAMYGIREFITIGGLMSYGVSIDDLYRRAAVYVDKVLKGVKPADLPVAQPTKFELVFNLKTAKALGLTVPPLLLAQADEVIECTPWGRFDASTHRQPKARFRHIPCRLGYEPVNRRDLPDRAP